MARPRSSLPPSLITTAVLVTQLARACGCSRPHGLPADARLVSLPQLGEETAGVKRFSYLGTDAQFHYFRTPAGEYCKLPEPEWRPPNRDEMIYVIPGVESLRPPDQPGFEQYVAVSDGQIVLAPLP
jgi:hypothetical protein